MATIYIIGAGPVGLLTAALLQRTSPCEIVLFEKRPSYTRTRMVTLSSSLLACELFGHRIEHEDGDDMRALFTPRDLVDLFTSKRVLPQEIRDFLSQIGTDFVPLNVLETSLVGLLESGRRIDRREQSVAMNHLGSLLQPGDTLIDCSGFKSLTRERLYGAGNTLEFVLEHALVASFALNGHHCCDATCKRSGSIGNQIYDFVPSVSRSHRVDGRNHVVGIVEITQDDYARLPRSLDQSWIVSGDPVAQGIKRFLDYHVITLGETPPSEVSIMTLPLNLYRAHHFANAADLRFGDVPDVAAFLLGDAAIGSPYFQSISLGFESAIFLAWLLQSQGCHREIVLRRFQHFMDRQWLRVYMRSKLIKTHKDILSLVDDMPNLLERLNVY